MQTNLKDPGKDADKWLAWRRQGLGASEARIVVGSDPVAWEALRDEKLTGTAAPVADSLRLLFDLGHAVEPVILDHFDRTVMPVVNRGIMIESGLDPWFRMTADGIAQDARLIEVKSHWMKKDFSELKEQYWPQIQHQLFVTQTDSLYFTVLFGHYARFEYEQVEVDQPFVEAYKLRAYLFKEYLETGVLPEGMQQDNMPAPQVERGRHHTWPTDSNEISVLANDWIDNHEAAKKAAKAEKDLKAAVPVDAISATWKNAEGKGVIVKVDRAGKKSLRAVG